MVYPALLPLMPHTSTASIRLNWRPPADLNGLLLFARKTKSGFCACAITFQLDSTYRTLCYEEIWRERKSKGDLFNCDESKWIFTDIDAYIAKCTRYFHIPRTVHRDVFAELRPNDVFFSPLFISIFILYMISHRLAIHRQEAVTVCAAYGIYRDGNIKIA